MHVPFGDLKRQAAGLHDELMAAAERVLRSGWFILGQEVAAFEQEFAAALGVNHCVSVGNGTEALQLALAALGVGPGHEVITVANAAVYEAVAAHQVGARPVFVDVEAESQNLDPALLAAAITPRTRAIMPVHLFGRPAALEPILAVAAAHGLAVVEDCAQSHLAFTTVDGARRATGTAGALGCFSFFPTKNLGALGDGGAVVTNDATLAATLRRLRQYGWSQKYITTDMGGINSRLDELQAAFLRVKLPHLPGWTARRRAIAGYYSERLAATGLGLPPDEPGHVYHLYVVRSGQRDALRAALAERGVGTDVHYPLPAHRQPAFASLGYTVALPVTEALSAEILSLPIYPELSDVEVEYVASSVRAVLLGA